MIWFQASFLVEKRTVGLKKLFWEMGDILTIGVTWRGDAPPIFFLPNNSLVISKCIHLGGGVRVGEGVYTECNRRNGPDFGRVFLRSNYTDITQNTYIQSSMVTEILAREV